MNIESIRTFIAVAEYGNISTAAEHLFIAQSNISKRLQLLEEELGVQLLIRERGMRKIELTPYGKAFLKSAREIDTLWVSAESISKTVLRQPLYIGATDLMNQYTFGSFYQAFMDQFPHIILDISTYHSSEIHRRVSSHALDIGFAYGDVPYTDVDAKALYKEEMYALIKTTKDNIQEIDVCELNPQQEIYINWSREYAVWHDEQFGHMQYKIRLGTGSMITDYLKEDGDWAIVPHSLAHSLSSQYHLPYYSLKQPVPHRTCYMLVHRYPRENQIALMQKFQEQVITYIQENADVTTLVK